MIRLLGCKGVAILLVALALRLLWLDVKPPHFDEGVNGWFVDEMTRNGFYHYDPGNFHGPLHFYVLFVFQTLLGRAPWVLRLPVVLASTGCVALAIAFARHLDRRVCWIAAAAMAVSPGLVFYGRYAIHETWLLFFLMLTAWGIAEMWRYGSRAGLWTLGLGFTGMVLTKETYIIHAVSLAAAFPTLLLFEKLTPSSILPKARQIWKAGDALGVAAVCIGSVLFFYTGGFLDSSSLSGLGMTFVRWFQTGTGGETGHEKEWSYWLQLMGRYEWPALAGVAGSLLLWRRCSDRLLRYLIVAATGTLTVYSLIPYKTPWCLIVLIWPFFFAFGAAVIWMSERLDRWAVRGAAALLCCLSLALCAQLNYRDFAKEDEPYVYVQTLPDIDKLIQPLRTLVARDAKNFHLIGHIVIPDVHPLPWLLGDFTHVNIHGVGELPNAPDAAFILIDDTLIEPLEPRLTEPYFKETLFIRGNAAETSVLYLSQRHFQACFPGRSPEFVPGVSAKLRLLDLNEAPDTDGTVPADALDQ